MAIPTITTAGLQQSGGAEQTLTVGGMTAELVNVQNQNQACAAGKKKLFTADRVTLIRGSRRRD